MFDSPPLADCLAFQNECGFALLDRTQIGVSGADRSTIMHNLCTNDINRLQSGEGCEAVFTNVQGKAVGYGYVFADDEEIQLDLASGWGQKLVQHLDRYVVMEDAEFVDRSSDLGALVVAGPAAPSVIERLVESSVADGAALRACLVGEHVADGRLAQVRMGDLFVRRVNWMQAPCFMLSGPRLRIVECQKVLSESGVRECSESAAHLERIEAGVPEYGLDVNDTNLPQELDRDRLAINFQKGCYLGQETVARIDALGQVNWLLRRLVLDGSEVPAEGESIDHEGKEVARIRSAVFSPVRESVLCLAYVRHGMEHESSQFDTPWGRATVLSQDRGGLAAD